MFYVYAIVSEKNGNVYVGLTGNIEKRVQEHNSGKTKSTKAFKPWRIFYQENCETRSEARKREKYFKSGVGKERLKEKLRQISAP
ncbi:MAG: GIY-YIG nuclease family protein [Bacteroidales bacterium]|nr:GIY-YIG nuclease family protein [Bacteroidales bacterium]